MKLLLVVGSTGMLTNTFLLDALRIPKSVRPGRAPSFSPYIVKAPFHTSLILITMVSEAIAPSFCYAQRPAVQMSELRALRDPTLER